MAKSTPAAPTPDAAAFRVRPLAAEGWTVPRTFAGTHDVGLADVADLLPPPFPPTVGDVIAAATRSTDPAWLDAMSAGTRAQIAARLAAIPAAGGGVHAFDLRVRLDDRTWLAAAPDAVAILTIVAAGDGVLADGSGAALSELLRRVQIREQDGLGKVDLAVRRLAELGAPWDRPYGPTLALREHLRVLLVDLGLTVGVPVGSVTTLPKEKREITIKVVETNVERTKDTQNVFEKATEEAVRSFTRDFTRHTLADATRFAKVTWSVPGAPPRQPATTTGEESRTVRRLAEDTLHTIRDVSAKQTREASVTVTREYERTATTESTLSRVVTLTNDSPRCVTFVYHRLNRRYRVHVDLVAVEVVHSGVRPAFEPTRIGLDAAGWRRLSSLARAGRGADLVARIAAEVRARYGDLGAFAEDGGVPCAAPPQADDPNARLFDLPVLAGVRRSKGPFPVCLSSADALIETDGLHADPRPSAFVVDPKELAAVEGPVATKPPSPVAGPGAGGGTAPTL